MGRSIALAICLAIAFALAWVGDRTPPPAPVTAPQASFSAARAMTDVEVIARAPHPTGTPANAAVRDYLVQRMTALGLETQVQHTDAFRQRKTGAEVSIRGGAVENVIGVLPGRDRTAPALALMAHYDSVPGSPGAADDAAGVAAALEIVRALKVQGQPARDVILLMTDGEEAGLLGAYGFFEQHPMAKRIGFLMNMESRGGGGRAQMFQTGAENGGAIDLFRKTATSPTASSLTVFMYEKMPNDTDFTVSKDAGIPGLNYAFIGRQFDYHSPTSTPANLDKGSLQHLGQETLAAAREAAFAPALPAKSPNQVYANTFAGKMLAYPPAAGWAVLALAGLLTLIGGWQARRAGLLRWLDLVQGVGATLYLVALSATLLRLARRATGVDFGFMEQRYLLAQVTRWEIALALLGVGALAIAASAAGRGRTRLPTALIALGSGAACSAFGGWDPIGLGVGAASAVLAVISFGRPATTSGAWSGVLLTGFLAALAMQVLAPTTAFLAAWPLAIAGLGAALTGMASRRSLPFLGVLAALGAVGLSWLLGFGHGLYLGLDMVELLAVIVWLGALLLWPLAHAGENEKGARMAALGLILLGFVVTAIVRFDSPWDARYPQATHAAYFVDAGAGRTWRITRLREVSPWTRQMLTADGATVEKTTLPAGQRGEVWAAKAAPITAAGPALSLTKQPDGSQLLRVTPPPGARTIAFTLKPSVQLTGATLNGRPLEGLSAPGAETRIYWDGAPQGVVLGFRAAATGAVDIGYVSVTERWPADAKPLPPRPADVMAFDASDATIVGGTKRFTW
ncbi:M20/M25/M40 family metallo-hydrolase [Phenylobacterium sp. Root700]|uniref:M20/M25/M40 family metallo-hydrolase n=1 Tax=Phenylobacterium sp. Root700 TaxID=1736591 RepID=UPI0006FE30E4|nr:M20/M25/M40 family metallo-hydrolase [Phenylobacterium sp. Root700]KRB46703.1 hypothetical protein ASE02_19740 [Phenylobacterium sp. Root700]